MNPPARVVLALGAALSFGRPSLESGTRLAEVASEPDVPGEFDARNGVLTLRSRASSMILVRRSTFTMGTTSEEAEELVAECEKMTPAHHCDAEQFSRELEAHRVTLSAFWLDRVEVTVAEYARCVAMSRCKPLPLGDGARRFDRPTFPASLVTWDEARDYCAFRGARLPTEAEFERAARGTAHRKFPWGDFYNSHASNHGRAHWRDTMTSMGFTAVGGNPTDSRDGFVELAPVGSFPQGRTPDGFLDLAGNVAEWASDYFAIHYDEGDVEDPTGPATPTGPLGTSLRAVRGGSYENGPSSLRGAARDALPPNARRPSVGFRCAKYAASRPEPR